MLHVPPDAQAPNVPERPYTRSDKAAAWYRCSRWINVAVVTSVAACWSFRDSSRIGLSLGAPAFWGLVLAGIFVIYLIAHTLDRAFLDKRWAFIDLIRLAFWRTIFPSVCLVLISLAFEAFYDRRLFGLIWLLIAGILAVVGAYRLRVAQGFKLRKVKSGEVYKRALFLAKETRTPIKRVYVVPAGRGHLTNAYGMPESIAITDNYGKFLHGSELDSVICHELGHVKERHGRKRLFIAVITYAILASLAFVFLFKFVGLRPYFDLLVILLPVLALNLITRKFEYEADKAAVEVVGPEVAIQALSRLYEITRVPAECNRITELFMTHPSLVHRIGAMRSYDMDSSATFQE